MLLSSPKILAVLAVALSLPSFALNAEAATITWIGGVDGNWLNAANWSPAQVPSSADDAVIDLNATVSASGATSIAFATLVLGDAGGNFSPTLRLSAAESTGGSVMIHRGATLQQDTNQQIAFGSLTVMPGGTLTHTANSSARSFLVNLSVAGGFDLQAGATIAAGGRGYAGGNGQQDGFGPGAGISSDIGAGGAHGGAGGQANNGAAGGAAYDSTTNPIDLGSGGGGAYTNGRGGAGGGAVLVSVGGVFSLNGQINANGGIGTSGAQNYGVGGGAGGTVNITAAALNGTGSVLANGAAGVTGVNFGGGGGGGRIAVVVSGSDASSLTLHADSASGGGGTATGGGSGVIARKGPGAALYSLTIGDPGIIAQSLTPISGAAPSFAAVTVNKSKVTFAPGSTVEIESFSAAGAVDLSGTDFRFGGPLTVQSSLQIAASDLFFPAGSPIEVQAGASLSIAADSSSGGRLFVRPGATFRQASASTLAFDSVLVERGGLLTHSPNGATRTAALNLNVTGNFDLQAGATVAVSGLGYAGGSGYAADGKGPGAGAGLVTGPGSGAGHGGAGGAVIGIGAGGASYGSATAPLDLGSGGGGGGNGGAQNYAGGAGGGAVIVNAGGSFTLGGLISANGLDGTGPSGSSNGSGGGAGGTVNIRAAAISGSGLIQANGGAGGGPTVNLNGGGGAGGRIAVTATGSGASTLALEVNGGSAGGANSGGGARGTIIENGVLSGGTTSSVAILAFSQMQEKLAVTKVLGETLSAQLLDFAGATSTGVPAGSFSLAEMRLVMIKTGPFANKGFFRGRWTLAIPGGSPLSGDWEGMAYFAAGDSRRLLLKGALKGGIQAVLDGSLTESAAGSGAFDRLTASCRLVQAGNTMGASSIYISGSGVVSENVQYPGTALNFLQAAQSGEVGGYYSTPLDVVFSLVRVDSPGNPYQGEGFFAATYESPLGPGSGWAYAAVSGAGARLAGTFDQSLRGLMEGTLTLDSPRALFLTLQNLEAGLPLQADITVSLSLPGNVPVGGVATVIVELRNDGYGVAEGVTVVAVAPEKSRFLSATGDYRSYNVTHWRGTVTGL